MFHSQRDAVFLKRRARRRSASEGSNKPEVTEPTPSQSASTQRHSVDGSPTVKRVVLRKYSGETVPSSRSLAHRIACSEVEDMTGFWSRRVSSQRRTVSPKQPDTTSTPLESVSNNGAPASSSSTLSKPGNVIAAGSASASTQNRPPLTIDKNMDRSRPQELPRPSSRPLPIPHQPRDRSQSPISHMIPPITKQLTAPLQAPASRSPEAQEITEATHGTAAPSHPTLPPLSFPSLSFLSEPPPTTTSGRPMGTRTTKERSGKRSSHSSRKSRSSSRARKASGINAVIAAGNTGVGESEGLNVPKVSAPAFPPIYDARARAKTLVKRLSERRKKRRTGLARIVVELTVGAVAHQLDPEAIHAAEVKEIMSQLRRMKAA
ncbi:hypothetical protein M0805_005605 [Coniferiporia weirii]|nr:hypothetical protein M0805_005605 [Coniferiporia weirii]